MNAARVEKARNLLKKLGDWGRVEIDLFTLYPVSNYFDLLYDPEANGNHDSTGSYIIGERFLPLDDIERKDEALDPLRRYSIGHLFQFSDLLLDRAKGVIYNYDLAKREYERVYGEDFSDEEFRKRYEYEFEIDLDTLRVYPKLFVEEMKKFPLALDRSYLRAVIRRETDELIRWMEDPEEEKGTRKLEHLKLTDEEVEMLLDAHFRILDGSLKINDLVTPENLAGEEIFVYLCIECKGCVEKELKRCDLCVGHSFKTFVCHDHGSLVYNEFISSRLFVCPDCRKMGEK